MQIAGQNTRRVSEASSTAPAPSPNSTQVVRSFVIQNAAEHFSPTTRARRAGASTNHGRRRPPSVAYTKPLHTACTSKAGQPLAPACLQNARRRGEHHVRRRRGEDDQIQILRRQPAASRGGHGGRLPAPDRCSSPGDRRNGVHECRYARRSRHRRFQCRTAPARCKVLVGRGAAAR